ncbi:MAG: HDIG domain-containing protein [Clostridium butyricum]|nr:HDIG domain-containing protein [Clostridium butyricum]
MKGGQNKKEQYKNLRAKRIILFFVVYIIGYLLLISAITPKQYNLREGDIPRVDIKATRDIVDEKATLEKETQAIEKVGKQYTLKSEIKSQAENNIKILFEKLNEYAEENKANLNDDEEKKDNVNSKTEYEKILELKKIISVTLTQSEYQILLDIPQKDLDGLQKNILNIINSAYEKNLEENDEEAIKQAKETAIDDIKSLGFSEDISNILGTVVTNQIKPNFFYDIDKTEEKVKEAQKSVSKVIIKQNQIIVKEGEPVTAEQLSILSDLGMLDDENVKEYLYVYLILGVFLATIMFLQVIYVKSNYEVIYKDTKKLALISVVNLISLIFARVFGLISPFLIPFACAPMLLSLLINYKISLVLSCLNIILITALNGFDIQVMMIGVICSLLSSTLLKRMQQRNELLYTTVYIAVISAIITLTTGILISSDFMDILIKSGMTFIGGVLSGVFAIGILPFLESTFNEVTVLKLLELSNPNSPLLKRLLMEAPGTYHHSILVANLAELAAEEIGANAVIARVGSYYHDVGKVERPYFFGENLMGMENPHNKIPPSLSASIIISHVKDGLELAKKHKLPRIIQEIIGQHHGKTVVKYFYYTMKNNSDNPEEIKKEDYMYPGPIPSSKEAGIVMLADSTEAAVRSIKEPTKEKVSEMINNIINDKLSTGQLNNCELTLKDIEKIRKCFMASLNGIYHQRVEYPKEKKKEIETKE